MSDEDVLFEKRGSVGHILLNRPKALNALTLDMVLAMTNRLRRWASDEEIAAVVIEGVGEKGFCAGGDIRALYDSGKAGTDYWYKFYSNEYRLDTLIFEFPKPYIALMDGITMGGGVGVSVNGKYRVATERTMFAMPETGIGLIPDVGGSFFLPRLAGKAGVYLGLTGERLRGPDCVRVGVATHFVPANKLDTLVSALSEVDPDGDLHAQADDVLGRFAEPDYTSPYNAIKAQVDELFSGGSVQTILSALEADGGEWALKMRTRILSKSPTSVFVAFEQLLRGKMLSFRDGIAQELRCVMTIRGGNDFYEGVRAIIIDKDNEPKWNPSQFKDVSSDAIKAHFADIGKQELVFL